MPGQTSDAPSWQERRDRLRLIRSENVGPRTFRALLAAYGTATAAIAAVPALSRRGGRRRAIRLCPPADAERELAALADLGADLLTLGEAAYPAPLAAIDDAPPVLAVRGDMGLVMRTAVAVVGARNASINGRKIAEDLARGLGTAGLAVVSGLARGIDAAGPTSAPWRPAPWRSWPAASISSIRGSTTSSTPRLSSAAPSSPRCRPP